MQGAWLIRNNYASIMLMLWARALRMNHQNLESPRKDSTPRPQKTGAPRLKEHGIWVLRGGIADIDVLDLMRQQHDERSRHLAGLDSTAWLEPKTSPSG